MLLECWEEVRISRILSLPGFTSSDAWEVLIGCNEEEFCWMRLWFLSPFMCSVTLQEHTVLHALKHSEETMIQGVGIMNYETVNETAVAPLGLYMFRARDQALPAGFIEFFSETELFCIPTVQVTTPKTNPYALLFNMYSHYS